MTYSADMNKAIGTKWFTFFTKVRPVFACLFIFVSIADFFQNVSLYIRNIGLLISFIAGIAYVILNLVLAIKSDEDYGKFVSFVGDYLIFEIIFAAYQSVIQQYYQYGGPIISLVIYFTIILLIEYFIWYRTNMKYFQKRLLPISSLPGDPVEETPPTSFSANQNVRICISDENDLTSDRKPFGFYGSDIVIQQNADHSHTASMESMPLSKVKQTQSHSMETKTTIKYCSRCGNSINPRTKKCAGCGKQYFKGLTLRTIFLVTVLFLLLFSSLCNVCLYLDNKKYKIDNVSYNNELAILEDENAKLEEEKEIWYHYWQRNYQKVELIDTSIVFIENDGTNLYHKYECNGFIGEDWWAHNIEYAEYMGFNPCPACIN